jgi:AcrR family transcriptional regulator
LKASREDKINKICDIAFSLFLDRGYEAPSMRNICKDAGVEQPTLYYFFGSKEGLFFSIINRLWDQYKQFNEEYGRIIETVSQEERLYSIFRNSVFFAMENRRPVCFYYRYFLFPPVGLKKKVHAFLDNIEREYRQQVENCIGELIGRGIIKKDQVHAYLTYYTFVNNQMFNVTFSEYTPSETELKELWDMFFQCRLQDLH